jgi:hypothetical protein
MAETDPADPADPVVAAARAAAGRLAGQYGTGLAAEVEAVLHAGGPPRRDQYVDLVEVGSLIVSTASLAWSVYTGLKAKTARPSREVVERALRVELRARGQGDPPEEITSVVVTEIIKADAGSA